MIKRILLSAVVSLGLVLGFTVAPASAASHEIWIDGTSVTASPIKSSGSSKVVIRVNFGGSAGYALDDPYVTIESVVSWDFDMIYLEPTSRSDIWTATYYIPNSSTPGKWWLGVYAYAEWSSGDLDYYNDFYQGEQQQSFNVQRPSKLTLNATPEPADEGDRVKVTGNLQLLRFRDEYYATGAYWSNLSAQKVKLFFDPTGSEPRRYVTTVTTNSSGVYQWTWKASRTGVWSAEYAGTATRTFVVSAGDKILVG